MMLDDRGQEQAFIMEESASDIPGDMDEASRLRERLFLAPHDTGAMIRLAALREASGDLPGAIDLYQRAVRTDPYNAETLLSLARLWAALGEPDRAAPWLKRALAIDPDSPDAALLSAALATGPELTPIYIRTLFDQYAARFDAELTGTLNYRAPEAVAAILDAYAPPGGHCDILDLGCGTGLSGQALRPFARRLDGVDLSPGMVSKAHEKAIYDRLDIAEAQAFLGSSGPSWDIIAAVDMLNYIGDLTPIFATAAARLNPGGLLTGTVEKGMDGEVALTAKRRHTHGLDHLIAAAANAGLRMLETRDATLRSEGGVPVSGLVFIAYKVS
jgi:predicted TPR repeat methyltransferase